MNESWWTKRAARRSWLLAVGALLALAVALPAEADESGNSNNDGNADNASAQAVSADPLAGERIAYDEAQPAAGRWIGTVEIGGPAPDLFAVTLTHAQDEDSDELAWSASVHATAFALAGTDTDRVEIAEDGRGFAVVVTAFGGHYLHIEATLASADNEEDEGADDAASLQYATGTLERRRNGELVGEPLALNLRRHPSRDALEQPEHYRGAIEPPGGMDLDFAINLGRTPGGTWLGTISIEMQAVRHFPLSEVEIERHADRGDSYRFVMSTLHGDAVFTGELDEAGETVTGTFEQAGQQVPFTLERTEEAHELRRPQTPQPPFPYLVEEVRIEHPEEGHVLAGTLTLPDNGAGPYPAAVLLTGSGPQDRDETILGHKPFAVIADTLTRNGFAVLRCDDRGIGESGGDFGSATTADFASDAHAMLAFLHADERIGRTGLIGHSEGGLKAIHAAARDGDYSHRVAFIVILGGPGVPGDEVLLLQQRLIAEAEGAEPEQIELNSRIQRHILPLFAGDLEGEALENAVRDTLEELYEQATEEERTHIEDRETLVQTYLLQLGSPWFRYFLRYDPREDLERIDVPVLALNGMLDLQVDWEQNLPEIWKALIRGGNHKVTIKALPNLNHLFQECETGAVSQYGRHEQTFAPKTLEAITDWLQATLD